MSNKIVPDIYRTVVDDVIASVRPAFEEFDVPPEILQELQHKWETKILASRVADFRGSYSQVSTPTPPVYPTLALPGPSLPSLPGPQLMQHNTHLPSSPRTQPLNPAPAMGRYASPLPPPSQSYHYSNTLPPIQSSASMYAQQRHQFDLFDANIRQGTPLPPPSSLPNSYSYRIPQTDGPAHLDDEEEKTKALPPRSSHPSLPPPLPKPTPGLVSPSNEINSDLDDSDSDDGGAEDADGEGGGQAGPAGIESDIIFCTYEKVGRVKNKWKCVLKDGVVHTAGKDWLFERCTGEFEW
ncbi:transcription factor IIA, alpha/beta subunit-domain-containing protein, partial [Roridomyces roridus]